MPEPEARGRAVYDHNDDEPRPAGRRRRQVADWGVGEELFDGMPGRRFERRGADHPIPRGGADDGRRTIVISEDDVRVEDEAPAEEYTRREDALEARREHDAVWAGDEPFAPAGRRFAAADGPFAPAGRRSAAADEPFAAASRRSAAADEPFAPADEPFAADEPPADPFAAAAEAFEAGGRFAEAPPAPTRREEPDGIVRGGVEGRRTVKIGGRPAEFHSPSRRPPKTVHERLGPRPDRIAAWAFALGLLLILIAVATASI
jgi:hypothetical protein